MEKEDVIDTLRSFFCSCLKEADRDVVTNPEYIYSHKQKTEIDIDVRSLSIPSNNKNPINWDVICECKSLVFQYSFVGREKDSKARNRCVRSRRRRNNGHSSRGH